MKNIFVMGLSLALGFSLASCNSEHEGHTEVVKTSETSESAETKDQKTALEKEVEEQALKIFAANFQLHQAFVKDDVELIQQQAVNLREVTTQAIAAQPTLVALAKVDDTLKLMATQKEVEELTTSFGQVNLVLVDYLLAHELSGAYNVYYCPMVDKRWIQDSAQVLEVQNPYALYMLKCGTKETSFNI